VDRWTPGAECQWWADRLGDECWSAGAPTVFPSHGSCYGNWEVFSPRVRTVRLQGGVVQLSPEKDHRTSMEGVLPCRHLAMVCCSHFEPAGSRRWTGKGAMVPNQTPPPHSRRHVGTGQLGPVHCSGGGDGGGVYEDGASLGFPTSSPTGETVRRLSPPVKAQLWPEMSPVMGCWRGSPRWPLGGTE
jgi:hypothetical protein